MKQMRRDTLEELGLGTVLEIFRRGSLTVTKEAMVDKVFGKGSSMLISGGSGIVGAGKAMQLGSRLIPLGVKVLTLDMPGAPDGIEHALQPVVAQHDGQTG